MSQAVAKPVPSEKLVEDEISEMLRHLKLAKVKGIKIIPPCDPLGDLKKINVSLERIIQSH